MENNLILKMGPVDKRKVSNLFICKSMQSDSVLHPIPEQMTLQTWFFLVSQKHSTRGFHPIPEKMTLEMFQAVLRRPIGV